MAAAASAAALMAACSFPSTFALPSSLSIYATPTPTTTSILNQIILTNISSFALNSLATTPGSHSTTHHHHHHTSTSTHYYMLHHFGHHFHHLGNKQEANITDDQNHQISTTIQTMTTMNDDNYSPVIADSSIRSHPFHHFHHHGHHHYHPANLHQHQENVVLSHIENTSSAATVVNSTDKLPDHHTQPQELSTASPTTPSSQSQTEAELLLLFTSDIQIVWSVVFFAMIVFGLLTNMLVLATIGGHKSLHTVTNCFLLNLTVSDLVTLLFNATFNFVFMITGHWPFGHRYCVANNFITNLTIAISVFTIMFTSKERYNAIVHPLQKRMTKNRVFIYILIIWFGSAVFASPTLIFSRTVNDPSKKRTLCLMIWPDGYPGKSKLDFIYNLLFLVLTYILPLMTMAIAYTLMSRVLWGSKQIGESTQVQISLVHSKQKVVRMLICVVIVFAVCWLPYHIYFLTTNYWPELTQAPGIQHIYLAIYWLAMSNSVLNPIILLMMNKRFRRYSTKYLNFWPLNRMFGLVSLSTTHSSNDNTFNNNTNTNNSLNSQSCRRFGSQKALSIKKPDRRMSFMLTTTTQKIEQPQQPQRQGSFKMNLKPPSTETTILCTSNGTIIKKSFDDNNLTKNHDPLKKVSNTNGDSIVKKNFEI